MVEYHTSKESLPLDKAMPLETALSFFIERYSAESRKSVFMRNTPATKRLRECYWGVLGCAALDILEGKRHYVVFPSEPRVDLRLLSAVDEPTNPAISALEFDVKEYTQFSTAGGFQTFFEEKVKPKLGLYGIIIGIQEDVVGFDPSPLLTQDNKRGVLLITSPGAEDQWNPLIAEAHYFVHGDHVKSLSIDLTNRIIRPENRVVFDNELRIR